MAGAFDTEQEANNAAAYLKTKFVRFLVAQLSVSQDINKDKFSFVPSLPMTEAWDDFALYKKFGLSAEDVAHIESMIKEMV